jgi:hypothetical protein
MGANAYYREIRAEGIAARRSEVLKLYKLALEIVTASPHEPFRDPGQVPDTDALPVWPTRKQTGIKQNVRLLYRDRTTGEILSTHWSIVTPNGVVREQAVAAAINAYAQHAEDYNQDLIHAVHASAYKLVPGIFQ